MNKTGKLAIFSERLKKSLQDAGLSNAKFAEKAELTAGSVSNYLVGRSEPSYQILVRIAKILKVPTDYLLGVSNLSPHLHGDAGIPIIPQPEISGRVVQLEQTVARMQAQLEQLLDPGNTRPDEGAKEVIAESQKSNKNKE